MKKKKFDVLVVGELNVDLIMDQLEGFPALGKEVIAKKKLLTMGSSAAIFACNLSTLGSKVAFCGRIGHDEFGDKILADLTARGVDTTHIIRSESADTGITIAINDGNDRAMVTYPGAMNELQADEVTNEMLSTASHLHVTSIFLQPALKPGLTDLFRRAKQLGLTTSLDPQWDPAEQWHFDWTNLLPVTTVFMPNLEELTNITSHDNWEESLAHIKDKVNAVAVKKGADGALLWTGRELLQQAPFVNEEVADAIGAGDSFDAGFIHHFVRNKQAKDCLELGALCGAINTTRSGGTTAFANYDLVKEIALTKFNYRL